jgi:hypothetical protein
MCIKVNVRSWAHQKFMWCSENLGIGKIRATRYWVLMHVLNFGVVRKNDSVQVHAIKI